MRGTVTALLASLGLAACPSGESADRQAPATPSSSPEAVGAIASDSPPPISLPPSSDRAAWYRLAPWSAECEGAFRGAGREGSGIEVFPLGPRLHLVQVQCDFAAYQAAYNYVLRDVRTDPPRNTLLRFPEYDGRSWSLQEWVAGLPAFFPDSNQLQLWSKARGIGDCGQLARYGFPNGELTPMWVRVRACVDEGMPSDSVADPHDWPLVPLDSIPGLPGRPG